MSDLPFRRVRRAGFLCARGGFARAPSRPGQAAELGFQHLSGRGQGKFVDETDLSDPLVRRHALRDVLHQLLGHRARLGGGDHEGDGDLADGRHRPPDDRRLEHCGVSAEDVLQLARVHVVALVDEHVL